MIKTLFQKFELDLRIFKSGYQTDTSK